MPQATLINNTDLNLWANHLESQSKLPQLMRRLIRITTPLVKKLHFPSDESVQLGGWDGIVEVEKGNDFVPDGISGWELGVERNTRGKANDDYDKRTANPGDIDPTMSAFIFVTPRRWGGKDKWVNEKAGQGKWFNVRAYDANDIEKFLEIAPAVHIWISILVGKRPEGATDIENYWNDWVAVTLPQTTPALVIAGREDAANKISDWLRGQASCLSLQSETQDEAVAFLAACIQRLPADLKDAVLGRSIVVDNETEWRRLSLSSEPLILIPTFGERSIVASAIQRGHHVLLPLGLSEAETTANIALHRPQRDAVYQALEEMNVAQSQVGDLATLGRRSLVALRRRLAINPSLLIPNWAESSAARALLPALLVGRWHDSNGADRDVISRLAGSEYSKVNEVLLHWANAAYPFVRRVGDVWLVVSKADSWLLLSRFVTSDDLRPFEEAVLEVLAQSNPKYELALEQRRVASFFGKQLPHSGHLRAGVGETLALMAGTQVPPFADGTTGQDWADRIVNKLFDRVTDWEGWATLDEVLVSLAEASPDNFLNAVDSIVTGEEPIAVSLFRQEDSYWGGPEHSGLLWALELLAWSPKYLSRVAVQLAQLSRLDPGGKWTNRPENSLRSILLILYPCTMAALQQRLTAIDLIRKQESDVAWKLMLAIVPQPGTTVHKTHTPEFRDWGTDTWEPATSAEVNDFVRELVDRLVEDVGTNENRWNSLIPLVADLPQEQFTVLVQKMRKTFTTAEQQEPAEQLLETSRKSLREILSRHMSYPEAEWSMSKERLEQLQQIYIGLEPKDLVLRHAWQFSHAPHFMLPETENWHERHNTIENIRKETVRGIYDGGELTDTYRLAQAAEDPFLVGWALGSLMSMGAHEDDFLAHTLAATETHLLLLGMGYSKGRLANDPNWLQSKLTGPFVARASPLQKANFYLCFVSERRTWDLVNAAGVEVEEMYWRRVALWGHGKLSEDDLQYLIKSLASHDRLTEAIHYISVQSHSKEGQLPPSFIMNILEMAVSEAQAHQINWSQLVHDIPRLLKIVETSKEIEDERLGRLELLFLSWLEYSEYQPKALMRSLNENPTFFCDLVDLVFKSDDGEPTKRSPEEHLRRQASELLRLWRTLPGSDDQGNINQQKLSDWVTKAVNFLRARDYAAYGEMQIGQLLSHSPKGLDGLWPHEAVCAVIEEVGSEQLERGFQVGAFNNRGVITRSLTEGGVQEREIAARYRNYADKFRDQWPRSSQLLDRMANEYDRYARGQDTNADLTQDLWR
jgi:hypothetical protein